MWRKETEVFVMGAVFGCLGFMGVGLILWGLGSISYQSGKMAGSRDVIKQIAACRIADDVKACLGNLTIIKRVR